MLVGFKAKGHPQQKTKSGFNPAVDDRALTAEGFEVLQKRFAFTVDAASSIENRKLDRHWTIADDGLKQSWAGERVYCNPPYSNIMPWIQKAWCETFTSPLIVLLLPANRTEQKWWQNGIEPYRDRVRSPLRTEFVPGRIRFLKPGQTEIKPNERPPFGCVLCIWDWGNAWSH